MAEIVYLVFADESGSQLTASTPKKHVGFDLVLLFKKWKNRTALRRMLRDVLLPGPDSVLADAGWTREAAGREAAKPFWKATESFEIRCLPR